LIWEITPILGGEFGMVRDDIKYENGNPGHSEMVPSYIFLLESKLGKVLVDTSFGDPQKCREKLGLIVKREKPLVRILADAGINPEEITAIILTHLHWDHAANCDIFPYSKIYCQQLELDAAFTPGSDYPPVFVEGIKNSMHRILPLRGDADVMEGIGVVLCGGHTTGSQMIEVQTGLGTAIISGDTIMTYKNIEQRIPVGLRTDPEACRRVIEKTLKKRGMFLLPSHDYLTMNYLTNAESCKIK